MIFNTLSPASKQLLLDNVSELDIFILLCPHFKTVGRHFRSPIILDGKPNTGIPAANIYQCDDGHFLLTDYRVGETFGVFNFAKLVTGLDLDNLIIYLCDAFGITNNGTTQTKQKRLLVKRDLVFNNSVDYIIDVKYEPWSVESLKYWIEFGWQPYMLDKAYIRPIERFWMDNNDDYRQLYERPLIGPISFTYDFGEQDGIFKRKIYNPLTKQKTIKWKNNTNKSIIQGLNTIDYHVDVLYIVSSLKDCGPFWSIFNKPCAIAPNSESSLFSPNQIRMIRQISDRQIIWMDNDITGRYNAQKQANLYGFDCTWNPIGSPKDQSDYWKERGSREFNKLIYESN